MPIDPVIAYDRLILPKVIFFEHAKTRQRFTFPCTIICQKRSFSVKVYSNLVPYAIYRSAIVHDSTELVTLVDMGDKSEKLCHILLKNTSLALKPRRYACMKIFRLLYLASAYFANQKTKPGAFRSN
jgi:hypothetical protein